MYLLLTKIQDLQSNFALYCFQRPTKGAYAYAYIPKQYSLIEHKTL